ncbi:MAG: hypothetical protein SAJ12_11385 [Jaaginema sp. PMC 1079.18]|nr:hypothetical protein [Jaaginema sp. PMC 1080.18]MEC4851606.1 hypothetical protein [Jaaginema sp. PMC 1079.18]MEC4868053.1 hypothetical protein [Jaaginema sp. PMC 1078.18]
MFGWPQLQAIALPVAIALIATTPASALPGESTEKVLTWIQAHPTLRPQGGETTIIRKADTPAMRFTYEASVLPPGRITVPANRGEIRSEYFSVYDQINGVPPVVLEEYLRDIYGLDIYQDYQLAATIYAYPQPETIELSRRLDQPGLADQWGELRSGKRFAYWLEVAYTPEGNPISGRLTIFLKEDLEKLLIELRDRV